MDVNEKFAHVPEADRQAAVDGFVGINPHYRGVDFMTMMEIILDADAHLPLIGDVVIDRDQATLLVERLAGRDR